MDTIATTAQGRVQGREKDGVLLFAGIPYAAPPVGPLRFRPPAPREPWTGVRETAAFGPLSWQAPGLLGMILGGGTVDCDEDCLSLNVQTPALDDGARPVMVWIHGGGFIGGTGATPWYNGQRFVQHGNVVTVTINYRLGALGFLHLAALGGEAYASSGLNGILDQVAALEWVRDNITAFGGDPGNVTIFGESAGGMSVGTLLGMPRASGLFHRAIPQSGAAHNLSTAARATHVTELFLQEAGLDDLEGLLAADPQALIDAQEKMPGVLTRERLAEGLEGGSGASNAVVLGMPFQPVIDGVELPVPPLDAIRDGLSAHVPVLVGTTLEEWKLFHLTAGEALDDAKLERRLARIFPNAEEILATYREPRPGASADDVWCAILTDVIFRLPAIRLAETQAEHQPDNTFSYRFSWKSRAFDGRIGSCHALEIPFVFDNLDRGGSAAFLGEGPTPSALATAMHDSWWHFAHDGDPNHEGIPAWGAYDTATRTTIDFDDEIAVLHDPDSAERQVWDAVIP
jgi:para-nitrobenzyl esterase